MGDKLIEYYEDRCSGMMENKKIIKKVLMEEEIKKLPSFVKRRINPQQMRKSFLDALYYSLVRFSGRQGFNSLIKFKNLVISEMMENIHPHIKRQTDDNDPYDNDEMYDLISSSLHKIYDEEIEQNYNTFIKTNIKESEDKKLPSFFTRRVDHHKFEKMMRKGIPYIFHDSSSLQEFKYKLVEATLENYIFYKYNINIDEIPQEDKDAFIQHMIEVYDPVLTAYYRNFYKR